MAQKQGEQAKLNGNKKEGCVIVAPRYFYFAMFHSILSSREWELMGTGLNTENQTVVLDHATMNCLNEVSSKYSQQEGKTDDYLCTGYNLLDLTYHSGFYAFIDKEPCVMCSMALLHSRIDTVFYSKPNKKNGGLGSLFKIHCTKSLNHHFKVFRVEP
jgi:tRNA(Arg) A34 adenosine deaminase TadA